MLSADASASASTPRCWSGARAFQTSASVLPIRPDGSRPAFHVVGANATYAASTRRGTRSPDATHLHLGAPEFMGGEEAAKILSFAREHGVVTSADLLAPGEQAQAIVDWVGPVFAHLDYLLPNDDQVLGSDRRDGARRRLPRAASSRASAAWRRAAAPTARSWSTATVRNKCPRSLLM